MKVSKYYIFASNPHTSVCWYDRGAVGKIPVGYHLAVWRCDLEGLKSFIRQAKRKDYHVVKGYPNY